MRILCLIALIIACFGASPSAACSYPINFLKADRPSAESSVRRPDELVVHARVEEALASVTDATQIEVLAYRVRILEPQGSVRADEKIIVAQPNLGNCGIFYAYPTAEGSMEGFMVLYPSKSDIRYYLLTDETLGARKRLEHALRKPDVFKWKRIRFTPIDD